MVRFGCDKYYFVQQKKITRNKRRFPNSITTCFAEHARKKKQRKKEARKFRPRKVKIVRN